MYLLIDNSIPPRFEELIRKCEYQRKPKKYSLGTLHRRRISSSIAKACKNKPAGCNILFLTLTFPRPASGYMMTEREANVCWSKFAENLKKNYQLAGYVCVKELHKSGIPHFHCILIMPFQPIQNINGAWCHTFSKFLPFSSCAVRSGPSGMKVRSIRRAVQYVSKYVSKAGQEKTVYEERCLFIDHLSLDKGSNITPEMFDFLADWAKASPKITVNCWHNVEWGNEIFWFTNFFNTFEEILQLYIDNTC